MDLAATGLRRQPFQTRGTPSVLVQYASLQSAVRFLDDTRNNNHGLGLLHGPPLSGKTTIIHHFTASLPKDQALAVVEGAGMRAPVLLQVALRQFGYDLDLRSTNERLNMVKVFAIQQTTKEDAPLLIVEKANQLKPDALAALCELAELTVNRKSAVRMILVSDEPMLPILQSEAMQPISQRVTGRFLLGPLTRQETANYVYKKLVDGGCAEPAKVFPQDVCDALYAVSEGWPGVVDRLALIAMSKAKKCPVGIEHISQRPKPATETEGVTVLRQPKPERKAVNGREAAPRLMLTREGKTLKQIALDKPRLMIGRAEHNDLCVKHHLVSRQHAIFIRSGSTTFVLDLKSHNGTYVNGERVSGHALINNDIVSIGEYRIKFVDPTATRRTTLKGAGIHETTIAKSIGRLREVVNRLRIVS